MKSNISSLFWGFFRIGAFTFGGGYAMIPLIQREAVEKYHWIEADDILDIVAMSESTPGPLAINMATFVGYKAGGVRGSIFATLGVVLPSFLIILVLSLFYEAFRMNVWVDYAFRGIKAGVAVLLINGFAKLAKPIKWSVFNLVMAACALALAFVAGIKAVFIVLAAGITGVIVNAFIKPRRKGQQP